jgi:hypothetical protein
LKAQSGGRPISRRGGWRRRYPLRPTPGGPSAGKEQSAIAHSRSERGRPELPFRTTARVNFTGCTPRKHGQLTSRPSCLKKPLRYGQGPGENRTACRVPPRISKFKSNQ